jgi:hypothetical protein
LAPVDNAIPGTLRLEPDPNPPRSRVEHAAPASAGGQGARRGRNGMRQSPATGHTKSWQVTARTRPQPSKIASKGTQRLAEGAQRPQRYAAPHPAGHARSLGKLRLEPDPQPSKIANKSTRRPRRRATAGGPGMRSGGDGQRPAVRSGGDGRRPAVRSGGDGHAPADGLRPRAAQAAAGAGGGGAQRPLHGRRHVTRGSPCESWHVTAQTRPQPSKIASESTQPPSHDSRAERHPAAGEARSWQVTART